MDEIKNIPEFIALIKKYESITKEDIEGIDISVIADDNGSNIFEFDAHHIMYKLTGYGYSSSCTLCKSIDRNCTICVYPRTNQYTDLDCFFCTHGENSDTYYAIGEAETIHSLLKAITLRAAHMRDLCKRLNIQIN